MVDFTNFTISLNFHLITMVAGSQVAITGKAERKPVGTFYRFFYKMSFTTVLYS